jgi:hypothetical protein
MAQAGGKVPESLSVFGKRLTLTPALPSDASLTAFQTRLTVIGGDLKKITAGCKGTPLDLTAEPNLMLAHRIDGRLRRPQGFPLLIVNIQHDARRKTQAKAQINSAISKGFWSTADTT